MGSERGQGTVEVAGRPGETPARTERAIVRFGIPILLACSAVGAVLVSLRTTKSEIPNFSFGSHVVLAVQLTLLFFYGALLLLVPLVRAVSGGELPIELSMRGARFAEKKLTDASEQTLERLKAAEAGLSALADEAVRADQVGGDLRKLGQAVESLDVRDKKAAAEANERWLTLAKSESELLNRLRQVEEILRRHGDENAE